MKIYIRDDSKISYFKETWLKRDLGFQCLNPLMELMLRDRGYFKSSKLTDKKHKDSIHSSNILNLFPPSSRMRMTSTSTDSYLFRSSCWELPIWHSEREKLNVLRECAGREATTKLAKVRLIYFVPNSTSVVVGKLLMQIFWYLALARCLVPSFPSTFG